MPITFYEKSAKCFTFICVERFFAVSFFIVVLSPVCSTSAHTLAKHGQFYILEKKEKKKKKEKKGKKKRKRIKSPALTRLHPKPL